MKGFSSTGAKRTTLDALLEHRAAWKDAGEVVVMANGVFDLLHVGHLRYLEAARELGDRLVVAVNSDASTRAYKGPDRPIIPQADRAELVAGLACTDHVFVFEDHDVRNILAALQPDVHAKGTDYTEDTVPERDVVQSYGGRVAICGDPKEHSTTELIEAGQLRKDTP